MTTMKSSTKMFRRRECLKSSEHAVEERRKIPTGCTIEKMVKKRIFIGYKT